MEWRDATEEEAASLFVIKWSEISMGSVGGSFVILSPHGKWNRTTSDIRVELVDPVDEWVGDPPCREEGYVFLINERIIPGRLEYGGAVKIRA